MKTVFCDLCRQQLTEEEVEGTAQMPVNHGTLIMYPMAYLDNRKIDTCWRCLAEHLLTIAPPRRPSLRA